MALWRLLLILLGVLYGIIHTRGLQFSGLVRGTSAGKAGGVTERKERLSRRSFIAAASALPIGLLRSKKASATGAEPPAGTAENVRKVLESDYVTKKYMLTGDLTRSIYKPDCRFTDPTTDVSSVDKYVAAVKILFDPAHSQLDLLSLKAIDEAHIEAKWRLGGYIKFPWHPYVKPYEGSTVFTLNKEGLIQSHAEQWGISALDALVATLRPTRGP